MIAVARFCACFVLVAAPAVLSLHGEDLTIPLDGGSILIRNAHFITGAGYDASDQIPILSFVLENHTPSLWDTLVLRFDMGGFCEGELHQWSHTVNTSLVLPEGTAYGKQYEQLVDAFAGKVRKCRTEIIKARLIFAVAYPRTGENQMRRIEGVSSEPLDLEPELRVIQAKHEAEARGQGRSRTEIR